MADRNTPFIFEMHYDKKLLIPAEDIAKFMEILSRCTVIHHEWQKGYSLHPTSKEIPGYTLAPTHYEMAEDLHKADLLGMDQIIYTEKRKEYERLQAESFPTPSGEGDQSMASETE